MRPDWAPALVAQMLANIYRDRKTHPEPFDITTFLIGSVEELEQTPEQMALVAELSAGIFAAQAREEADE